MTFGFHEIACLIVIGFLSMFSFFILVPFGFLWGPALYFYVRSLTYRNFKFKKQDLVHLVPFVGGWAYFAWLYHFKSTAAKLAILAYDADYMPLVEILFRASMQIQIVSYLVAAFLCLRGYRKNLKEIYSDVDKKNLSWMNLILIGFLSIWFFDLVFVLLSMLGFYTEVLSTMTLILVLVFANVIVFKGLRQPEIFAGIEHKPKYQKSPLTREEKEQYLQRLQAYMETERPYLSASLTIDTLARRLSISSRYLSQVINETLGVNFLDFVNDYRVSEAKRILIDTTSNHRNILDVLFDSGLYTKSAFNRVFKQHTGMTPSEYKSSHGN
jgi:AraC-like DNA-binding protein